MVLVLETVETVAEAEPEMVLLLMQLQELVGLEGTLVKMAVFQTEQMQTQLVVTVEQTLAAAEVRMEDTKHFPETAVLVLLSSDI
tara:strand:- start:8 stop:262 length:255 start_codon:yes stop_codon:yes gene_type:complete